MKVSWGAKVSPDFLRGVVGMCGRLGCDVNHMMGVMAFETGETFRPDVRNRLSGAVGLIQFMGATAKGLGTTQEALSRMSAVHQLWYVEKHFARHRGRLTRLSDVYMAVLWPVAVGKGDGYGLFARVDSKRARAYRQNAGLDVDGDGVVTKGEATAKVRAKLEKGLREGNYRVI